HLLLRSSSPAFSSSLFFLIHSATTEIYTLPYTTLFRSSPAFRSRLFVTLRSSPADPTVFRTGTRSGCSTLTCSFTFSLPISHAGAVFTNPTVREEFVEHITLATIRIRVENQKHTALTILGHHRQ